MPDGKDYIAEFKSVNLKALQNFEIVPSTGVVDDVDQLRRDAERLKREVEVLWQCIKVLAKEREA